MIKSTMAGAFNQIHKPSLSLITSPGDDVASEKLRGTLGIFDKVIISAFRQRYGTIATLTLRFSSLSKFRTTSFSVFSDNFIASFDKGNLSPIEMITQY